MKRDTLSMRIRKAWPTVLQPVLLLLAVVVGVGSFVLVASGNPKSEKPAPPPRPPSILMVGDSLSAGKFGEVIQAHLERKYAVAAYASCGSSPEHWLREEPVFYTKCGYREWTRDKQVFRDRTPGGMRTPKIETLVEKHKPTIVVVQLGTNWMDRSLSDDQINSFLDRFIKAARRGGIVQKLIWITPPDSARLRKVQGRVQRLIRAGAKRDRFAIVDSLGVTHYQLGKTGGDGIHYNNESSKAWAEKIQGALDAKIAPPAPNRRLSSKFQADDSSGGATH